MDADAEKNALLSQLVGQLDRSQDRLARLENDAAELELLMKGSSQEQDAAYAAVGKEFAALGKELAVISAQLQVCTKSSGRLMLGFRDIIKLEQLEDVQVRLRDWPVEFFMPRDEFISLVKKRLTELP